MVGRTTPGEMAYDIFASARRSASAEGMPVRAVVRAALEFYAGLPEGAQRAVRLVLESGSDEVRATLSEDCGFAIARAGNAVLSMQLIANGERLGFRDDDASEEEVTSLALAMVEESRLQARGDTDDLDPHAMPTP